MCAQLLPKIAFETPPLRDPGALSLVTSQLPAKLPRTVEEEPLSTSPAREEPLPDSPTSIALRKARLRKIAADKRVQKAKKDLLSSQAQECSISFWNSRNFSSPSSKITTQLALVESALQTCALWLKENASKDLQVACARRLFSICISHFTDYCESLPEIPVTKRRGCSKRTYPYQIVAGGRSENIKKIKNLVAVSNKYLRLAKRAGLSRLFQIAPYLSNT